MKRIGAGAFESGQPIAAKGDKSGVTGHVSSVFSGVLRNPSQVNSDVVISSDENCVVAGPLTIGSSGSLTVNGVLVIV
jgi:hypothetical protein|tara:strand:- start:724 stop:957 length:234 start_codon:yes stop_codon:yes gene_type:complete